MWAAAATQASQLAARWRDLARSSQEGDLGQQLVASEPVDQGGGQGKGIDEGQGGQGQGGD